MALETTDPMNRATLQAELDTLALPIGIGPLPWSTNTAPPGWLLCDGSAVSRTTYADLFAVVGTTYGAGNGSTTFNVPDLRGRIPLGKDNMGGTSANRVTSGQADTLGGNSGAETHTLTESELPAHTHNPYRVRDGSGLGTGDNGADVAAESGGNRTVQTNNNTGSDNAHNNMQPYLTVNYIIYAGV